MSKADDYNRNEFEAGRLTWPHITAAVTCAQHWLYERGVMDAVSADGMAGPETRKRLIIGDEPAQARPTKIVDLEERARVAGERAVERMLELWKLNVRDPKRSDQSADAKRCKAIIDTIWRSPVGAGWSWEKHPYSGDGDTQWCGMMQAFGWSEAIPLDVRQAFFPSCYRLERWALGKELENAKASDPLANGRLTVKLDAKSTHADLTFQPRAGDIGIVGDGDPAWGDHIVGIVSYDQASAMFHTIEGNGTGTLGDGSHGQGVVKAMRPLGARKGHSYIMRRLIRPGFGDVL